MRKPIPIGFFTPSASYPAALSNRHFWYDPSDLTTITKDGANIVSRVNDKLGNGNDLVTGSCISVGNTLLFNGTDEYLKTVAIAAIQQPTMIYAIVKHLSYLNGDFLFDGIDATHRMALYQSANTPEIRCYAGSIGNVNSDLAINTWGIIRVYFNGASSKLIVNDETPITGNFGSQDGNGFTLGSRNLGAANYGNVQFKDIIAMPSVTGEAEIYAWLVTRL